MSTGVLEKALPNEGFTQQHFDILVRPVFRRQSLEKHHNFLCDKLAPPVPFQQQVNALT